MPTENFSWETIWRRALSGVIFLSFVAAIVVITSRGQGSIENWVALATGMSVVLTALSALGDWAAVREQRAAEFRWKKAELAMRLVEELDRDAAALNARRMIDWSNSDFRLASGTPVRIQWHEVSRALRPHDPSKLEFSEAEAFIRESFDALFDHFEKIAHFVRVGLIEEEDVYPALGYWAHRLLDGDLPGKGESIRGYLRTYRYTGTLALLERIK